MDRILSWGKWTQTQCSSVRLSSVMAVTELHNSCVTLPVIAGMAPKVGAGPLKVHPFGIVSSFLVR